MDHGTAAMLFDSQAGARTLYLYDVHEEEAPAFFNLASCLALFDWLPGEARQTMTDS
jgi:hypothetical protein